MKKLLSFTLAVTTMALCFAGCGDSSDSETTTSPSASGETKAQSMMIGGSGPLTGDYATYGISVKQGAQVAIEEINAAGGVNGIELKFKMEDDQADPTMAVSAYSKLMDDNMKVSLGAVTSGACIAVASEAKKDGILMLTPSGSQKECTEFDNGFRICFQDPDQGVYAADFIKNKMAVTDVAIIYDKSNDYSAGITDNFLKQAKVDGLNIATQQAFTNQSNTDFSVQLQAIKSSGAKLVFMPIYAQQAAYILTQAKKAGLDDLTFFGCDGLDGIIEKIGKENLADTEGVLLLTPFAADSKDAKVVSFVTAYKEKYNTVPDQFAADGYDAIYTIVEAMKQADIKDVNAKDFNEKIIAAMTQITVEGTTGTMTWTADGEPVKSATAVKIVNGQYVAY